MYPFSISLYEHTPKISYDKKAGENNNNIFTINQRLSWKIIIFTDVDLCIDASISK